MKTINILLMSLSIIGISACSSIPQANKGVGDTPKADLSRSITSLDLKKIEPIEQIIPQLARYKAVLIGETHTAYGDHLNQLAIIKQLHPHWNKMAIGLEFIQQPYQQALDDYIAGKISQEKMLRETQWYDRWRYDFRLYRPIFNYARAQKIPLIALNAPKEITKRISKVGIKGLTVAERRQLPQHIDNANKAYRDRLEAVYRHHASTRSKKFERFLETQLAWDESMADKSAQFLQKNPKYHLVILAGGGHLINREGIPSRLERRIKTKTAVVLNNATDTLSASQGDYLLFSPKATLPKAGKMGVMMEDTAKGVRINTVVKNSASAKAGLRKDDIILSIDSKMMNVIQDIKIDMMNRKPKTKVVLTVLRASKHKLSKKLTLQ